MKNPKIRFKGFADGWEQRKLGEVADIVGGGTPSTSIAEYWGGDIDWYAPAEITDQIYVSSSKKKITEQGFDNSSAKLLPVGTVLFTSRAGIGKTAILTNKGCTNQGFQSIVPHKNELDSYFIFSRTEELKRYGETIGAGSTFAEVSGKQMENMEMLMPKTMEEQQVIGTYFKNFDHLITLHQRKYEETKTLKKYMFQKMFPQNGSYIPEIRFDGFTNAWEQRKIGDMSETTYGGGTPKTAIKEYWNGDIPWIQSSDIVEHDVLNVSPRRYISYDAIKNSAAKIIPKNSLAIVTRVGVGKLAIMPFEYASSQDFLSLSNLNTDINFTAYALYNKLQNEMNAVQGTSIKGITKEEVLNKELCVPNLEEQQKVSMYFTNLDHLITLHQRKRNELQNIKKFMLQNMFV